MTETNRWCRLPEPKLECIVNQSIWMDPETKMADVIFPACTNFERNDIAEFCNVGGYSYHNSTSCNYRVIVYEKKCIEPSVSPNPTLKYLPRGRATRFKEDFTDGGKTEEDWIRKQYDVSDLPKYVSYEDFKKKGTSLFLSRRITNAPRPSLV